MQHLCASMHHITVHIEEIVTVKHEIAHCHFQCEGKQSFCSVQLLPAPFPTTKPWRLYCSNMAVATAHRRQGLATALLHRCQRIGDALCLFALSCSAPKPSRGSKQGVRH